MQFKYFDQPELFSSFTDEMVACDICNNITQCFDGDLFTGTDQIKSICPGCLAAGKLYEKNISTCNGDIATLKQQLKTLNKNLNAVEIDKIALEKTNELEKTTPPLVSWQDWDWPCAGGDYCKFIGYGSVPLYEKLAGKKDPVRLFIESFYEKLEDPEEGAILWEESLPGKEIKNYQDSNQYSTLFYVFKSLQDEKIITIWDCE